MKKKEKKLQNTQSTTSLAKKNPKNSQPYHNPMLWAGKNLTILLHNNIQGKKITKHPVNNISRQKNSKKFPTLPQSNALGKEKSHNTTTQ